MLKCNDRYWFESVTLRAGERNVGKKEKVRRRVYHEETPRDLRVLSASLGAGWVVMEVGGFDDGGWMGLVVGAAIASRRTVLGKKQPDGKAHPPADRSGAEALFTCQNLGGRGQHVSSTLSLTSSMQAHLVSTAGSLRAGCQVWL